MNLQCVFTGVSISYWSGIITPIVVFLLDNDPDYKDRKLADNQKEQQAMRVLIAFGVGEVLGGLFLGWVIDKFNPRRSIAVLLGIIIVMTGVTVYNIMLE